MRWQSELIVEDVIDVAFDTARSMHRLRLGKNRKDNYMETRDAQVGKMEMQLKQWGARLNELAAKAKTAAVDMQAEQVKLVEELKSKRDQFQIKLAELKDAGSDKWDTIKTGIEDAYTDLEAEFKKLKH